MSNMPNPKGFELVIGLVGAVGADLDVLVAALKSALDAAGYQFKETRVSHLLDEIENPPWGKLPKSPEDARYKAYMDAGDTFRRALKSREAMAWLAAAHIRYQRNDPNSERGDRGTAYILRSLKTPQEIAALRHIYGWRCVIIGAYSPRKDRVDTIAKRISVSHGDFSNSKWRDKAEQIIQRDESDSTKKYGQNVRESFPLADVFIDVSDVSGAKQAMQRAVEIYFSHPFHTPTRDECGMFHAQAAALRSASLGRQVGASIATIEGDIVAIGTNEVPKAGGGLYWCDDNSDQRDHLLGYDPNDQFKKMVLFDILKRLKKGKWLTEDHSSLEVDELVSAALSGSPSLMKDSRILSLIEFGRAVHAEMAALMDAARRGAPVKGCVLYSTTFPCHECARHIVAAGISKVIYIEPYPKSLVPELYPDSVEIDPAALGHGKVSFEPFVGLAPRIYFDAFTMVARKSSDGNVVRWNSKIAVPRLSQGMSRKTYLIRERGDIRLLSQSLRKSRVPRKTDPGAPELDGVSSIKRLTPRDGWLRDILESCRPRNQGASKEGRGNFDEGTTEIMASSDTSGKIVTVADDSNHVSDVSLKKVDSDKELD